MNLRENNALGDNQGDRWKYWLFKEQSEHNSSRADRKARAPSNRKHEVTQSTLRLAFEAACHKTIFFLFTFPKTRVFNQTLHASVRLQIKFAAETFKKHCGQGARLDNETSARKLNGAEVLFVKRKWSWLQPKQKLETGDLSLG